MKDVKLAVGEGADLLLKAEAARQEHAALQAYLQRGRAFKDLSDEGLQERWAETCRDWARKGLYDRPVAHDDAEAELRLRGLSTPTDMVRAELEALMAEADVVRRQMTSKDYGKLGVELASRYVKQRKREN